MAEQNLSSDDIINDSDLAQVSGGGIAVPEFHNQEQSDKLRKQEQSDKLTRGENEAK